MKESRPHFESFLARLGIFIAVGLSIAVGCIYWMQRDPYLVGITVIAEVVAFVGLPIAMHQFSKGAWGRGWGAILVTFLAAGWCGLTMYQKIDADTRAAVIAQAQETPAYVFAKNAADTAQLILAERLQEPRPACACPETIRAWEATQGAAIDRIRAERAGALADMEAAIPPASPDWIALGRGLGMELAKLIGLMVFGLAVGPPSQNAPQASRQSSWWGDILRRFRVPSIGMATALATSPAYAGEIPENTGVSTVPTLDPIVQFPETGARAKAFALRGRLTPTQIAGEVGVSRATVYRWFQKRDLQMKMKGAA